jgi:S1-C subfamily serine protease
MPRTSPENSLRLALSFLFLGASVAAGQQPARYLGRLQNGQIITGAGVVEWHASDSSPRLDNHLLLDPQNPFRWLRDRSLRLPDVPDAYLETFTADRLPGRIIAHAGAEPETFDGLPPHFVVEPQVELRNPRPYFSLTVRVAEEALRRIVWRRRPIDRYEPGTAFFRDGRSAKFRSVRFGADSAHLLLEDGQQEASFSELAELHFPQRDPWNAYFDELAAIGPHGESRLLQFETTDGLVATASRERFFPVAEGGAGDAERWLHGIQPAWSLDMLWVPHRNIAMRRSFAPHEVPLSRLLPYVEGAPSPLRGAGAAFMVNRSAEANSLESGAQEYGWGFGVLGASRLRLVIPDLATALEGRVGLDRGAGSGGAIQARIFLDRPAGAPLWQSAPVVGTSQTTDWGRLAIPAAPGPRRDLYLEIDPLLKNAPPGADPLDIRDLADWLDPLLALDPQKTQLEIARRTPARVYAWSDWSLEPSEAPRVWRNKFELEPGFNGVRLEVASPDQPLRLVRRFRPGAAERWLVVVAEHPRGAPQRAKLEVRAAGELAAEWEVPVYSPDPTQQQALAVPLERLKESGRDVTLEILQTAAPKESPVFWKEAAIVAEPPMLFRLFDDDAPFAAVEGVRPEALSWAPDSSRPGNRIMRVAGGGRFTLRLPREAAIRERPALGEFRYVRFAYRKSGKGRVAVELHRTQQDLPPVRYDAGTGEPSYGAAARVWSLELPDQWIVTTRDLFQDFGRADVAGLTIGVPDGEYALFDHFYLARSEKDFELIPAAPSAEETNREARRALAKNVLDRVVPATVAIDYGGRFSTGVLVSREGDVLTAGHAVIGPGRNVTVLLGDGRRLPAKTKGVARDFDLGLVRIQEPGQWPILDFGDPRNLPKDQMYVGVAHKKMIETQAPAAHVVGIQRALQGVIATDFDLDNWCAGGPLVDKDARLIGIHRGRSQFGGFLYTQLLDVSNVLARMRNDEVWGAWPFGSGPMMGVHVETLAGGCRVSEVYPDTPAVAAGIRVGDQIVKIDNQPVRRLEDIYQRLATADPGQQVALELRRGAESAAATISLIPRTP